MCNIAMPSKGKSWDTEHELIRSSHMPVPGSVQAERVNVVITSDV
jgi:hypothetical protein